MDVERIRREYDLVKSTLFAVAPFISSLLARARIVVSRSVETAAVSPDGVVIVNPDFWERLDWCERAWVLGHEVLHLAFRDHKRRGQRDPMVFNVACDAVNNTIEAELIRMPYRLHQMTITMDKIYDSIRPQVKYEDFVKLSKEELYELLVRRADVAGAEVALDLGAGYGSGEVLQEGDPSIYKDGREGDGDEVEERWRDAIARAYDLQKSVGRVPAGLKKAVDELLKSKLNWRSLLRQALRDGIGRTVVESWKRPSRKSDELPGIRRFTLPTVWALIDVSGSISDGEVRQFLGEVYEVAGHCPVKVVCWDAEAYEVVEARTKSDVISKVASNLRGGGGTMIRSALEKTLSNMRFNDVVVVLTDGYIDDLREDEVKKLLSSVASKASVAAFVSTGAEVEVPGWRFVKLSL